MPDIEFTQFIAPHGRKEIVRIDRPADVAEKAEQVRHAGLRFECELLRTGHVSLTATGSLTEDDEDGDLEIEVVPNGPEVPLAVDRLVSKAHALIQARAA